MLVRPVRQANALPAGMQVETHLNLVGHDGGACARHSHVDGLDKDPIVHAVNEGLAWRCVVDLVQDQTGEIPIPDSHVHRHIGASEVAEGDDGGRVAGAIPNPPQVLADATLWVLKVGEIEDDLGRVCPVWRNKHTASSMHRVGSLS